VHVNADRILFLSKQGLGASETPPVGLKTLSLADLCSSRPGFLRNIISGVATRLTTIVDHRSCGRRRRRYPRVVVVVARFLKTP
jgi:hypothetical protein